MFSPVLSVHFLFVLCVELCNDRVKEYVGLFTRLCDTRGRTLDKPKIYNENVHTDHILMPLTTTLEAVLQNGLEIRKRMLLNF